MRGRLVGKPVNGYSYGNRSRKISTQYGNSFPPHRWLSRHWNFQWSSISVAIDGTFQILIISFRWIPVIVRHDQLIEQQFVVVLPDNLIGWIRSKDSQLVLTTTKSLLQQVWLKRHYFINFVPINPPEPRGTEATCKARSLAHASFCLCCSAGKILIVLSVYLSSIFDCEFVFFSLSVCAALQPSNTICETHLYGGSCFVTFTREGQKRHCRKLQPNFCTSLPTNRLQYRGPQERVRLFSSVQRSGGQRNQSIMVWADILSRRTRSNFS